MRNTVEFKALVEQKMKQQRRAAKIRRQRFTALCASLCVLMLVVSLGWYFLKHPMTLPLRPEDSIPDTQSQIVTNDDGNSNSGSSAEKGTPEDANPQSDGTNNGAATDSNGNAATGGANNAGGATTPTLISPTMGSDRTIPAAEVTAVEYRAGKEPAQRSTDKKSIQTFLAAMVQRKQQSFGLRTPYTYNAELTLTFYDGEEILLTVILTDKQEMLCQFSRYVTECVQLSEKDYEDLYDLAPTPYSTPIKGEKIPVTGTVFDAVTLTAGGQTIAIEGAEMYALYSTVNAYFPESRQRAVTLRKVTHQLHYTSETGKELLISLDSNTGALRWEYEKQQMTVALNVVQRKALIKRLNSYLE